MKLIHSLYQFTEQYFLIKLSILQKHLEQLTEDKELLNIANKLELLIKKFWYKFYWKCKKNSKNELFMK